MKNKKVRKQEEEEFVPKAFKKDKNIQKQENKKSTKVKTNKRLKKFIIMLIITLIIVTGSILAVSAIKWRNIATDMLINENSIVVDNSGN